MDTQFTTLPLEAPSAPGPELLALVRGMLIIQGTSLRAVSIGLGVNKGSARGCLLGHWRGSAAYRLIHVLCKRAGVPAPTSVPDTRGWLTTREFSDLAGIRHNSASRVLREAFHGRSWRGAQLAVRRVPGGRFTNPYVYEVDPESLPQALRAG